MKKVLIFILSLFYLCGCTKKDSNDLIKDFSKKINNADSYKLTANMEIMSDEDKFSYEIDVTYLKGDYYKVSLYNTLNNHKQIILKNEDGVYVITPELNRSYKFESSWPSNSSQGYLLSSLLKDINTDDNIKLMKEQKYDVLKVKVNYPNNKDLLYEKIYFDKDSNLKKVVVYDNNDVIRMNINFTKINYNADVDKDNFKIEEYIDNNVNNKECEGTNCDQKTSNILDDIIYPLYLPSNTYLTSSDKIGEDNASRVILTFSGDKDFTIVEEVLSIPDEFEIIPVFGEPTLITDTLGVIDTNSIKWNKGNISYYITSNNLSKEELVTLASSMNSARSVIGSK